MKGTYGILLVAALVLVSGLIAYLGDILGRRLGRRRITLFGLRPRHTAIAVSVAAGMAITLLTLIVAAALSEKVRIGLTQVDQMRAQMSQLGAKLEESRKTLQAAEKRTGEVEKAREAALADLAESKRQMAEVSTKLGEAESKLKAVNDELAKVNTKLSESQKRLENVEAQLKRAREELKRGEGVALEQGKKLLQLETQRDALLRQRDSLTAEVGSLKTEAKSLRGERALIGVTAPILTEEVIFEVGEELGRQEIEANQPIAVLRQELEQFASRLEQEVRAAGAGEDENGRALIFVQVLVQQGSQLVRIYETSELMEMLARQIHAPGGSVIIRAFSMLNVPRGRPVPINLALVENHLLFKKGETLARIRLDPSKSEGELLSEIVVWLRTEVAARARQKSILPDLPPTSEKALLFGGDRRAVGRISPERLFSLLKEIKRRRAPVTVVAAAARDTWTAGPLDVELVIQSE
jgi:uncharacterized protein (DUF3084 family)